MSDLQGYHAHVYFDVEHRGMAALMAALAQRELSEMQVWVGRLVDRPIGPHPMPMFEINFGVTEEPIVMSWLQRHRGSLTVLVHEVTGDDPRDHSEGARWLGPKLPLDFSKLDPAKPTRVNRAG